MGSYYSTCVQYRKSSSYKGHIALPATPVEYLYVRDTTQTVQVEKVVHSKIPQIFYYPSRVTVEV